MSCPFCNKKGLGTIVYDDARCWAKLENEQSIRGYTLLILKDHYDTFMGDIPQDDLTHFWSVAKDLGKAIKTALGAENIYMASLCDGIKHFHIHLIPRYKWSEQDKDRFIELFTKRDGLESVNKCVRNNTLGGFWFLGDAERNYKEIAFAHLSIKEQEAERREIANLIRIEHRC